MPVRMAAVTVSLSPCRVPTPRTLRPGDTHRLRHRRSCLLAPWIGLCLRQPKARYSRLRLRPNHPYCPHPNLSRHVSRYALLPHGRTKTGDPEALSVSPRHRHGTTSPPRACDHLVRCNRVSDSEPHSCCTPSRGSRV